MKILLRSVGVITPVFLAALFSACSSNTSILLPGQSASDCGDKASKLGVCGSPRSIYEHQDRIKEIYYEEGESYRVDRNGRIFNVGNGKEIIPGVKPDDCGTSIYLGENDSGRTGDCGTTASDALVAIGSSGAGLSGNKGVAFSNRSLVVDTPQRAAVIRDMGWQQKVWIAPHENSTGDLVEAHGLYVVIQEPHWIVGEKQPVDVKHGVLVPTPLATEVLTDNHNAVSRSAQHSIDNFLREDLDKNIKNIDRFIESGSKKDVSINEKPEEISKVKSRPRPIFKPSSKTNSGDIQ